MGKLVVKKLFYFKTERFFGYTFPPQLEAYMTAITQLTYNPHNYPFGTPDFCAVDTLTPGILQYTFSTKKAALTFADTIQNCASQLMETRGIVVMTRPFQNATQFFPANPSIESYQVQFEFSNIQQAYQFSQKVGKLGTQSESDLAALPPPPLVRSGPKQFSINQVSS